MHLQPLLRGEARTLCALGLMALGALAADNTSAKEPPPSAVASLPRSAGTRVILLGTAGGPIIRVARAQAANLVVVDGSPYLIDVGNGVLPRLVAAGFQPSEVATVFITHHHLDHNGDLVDFMSYSWIGQRTAPVDIYGPYGTEDMVRAGLVYMAATVRIFRPVLPAAAAPEKIFRAHDIRAPGVVYQDAKVKVIAAENSHFEFAGDDESLSYRFETPDRIIVFTGDTGPSEALVQLARGADVLVSEVIDVPATLQLIARTNPIPAAALQAMADHLQNRHLTPAEVGKLAARAGVKTVVLTHFSPGEDRETDATRYVAGVRKHFAGAVIAGRDLFEY